MKNTQPRLSALIGWAAALVTLILCADLCLACLSLYRNGVSPDNLTADGVLINSIYTRENVGAGLGKLAPMAICWAALMVMSAVLRQETRKPSGINPENALRLMLRRVETTPAMKQQQKYRLIYLIGTGIILAICIGAIILYMTDIAHFTSWDLEMVMGDMIRAIGIPALIATSQLCLCAVLMESSYAIECAEAKRAPKRSVPMEKSVPVNKTPVHVARIILGIAATALIIAGILNGGMYDVLVKAINICTECIGLG